MRSTRPSTDQSVGSHGERGQSNTDWRARSVGVDDRQLSLAPAGSICDSIAVRRPRRRHVHISAGRQTQFGAAIEILDPEVDVATYRDPAHVRTSRRPSGERRGNPVTPAAGEDLETLAGHGHHDKPAAKWNRRGRNRQHVGRCTEQRGKVEVTQRRLVTRGRCHRRQSSACGHRTTSRLDMADRTVSRMPASESARATNVGSGVRRQQPAAPRRAWFRDATDVDAAPRRPVPTVQEIQEVHAVREKCRPAMRDIVGRAVERGRRFHASAVRGDAHEARIAHGGLKDDRARRTPRAAAGVWRVGQRHRWRAGVEVHTKQLALGEESRANDCRVTRMAASHRRCLESPVRRETRDRGSTTHCGNRSHRQTRCDGRPGTRRALSRARMLVRQAPRELRDAWCP